MEDVFFLKVIVFILVIGMAFSLVSIIKQGQRQAHLQNDIIILIVEVNDLQSDIEVLQRVITQMQEEQRSKGANLSFSD